VKSTVEAMLAAAPGTMRGLMGGYLEAMRVRNYTEGSVEFRAHCLEYFAAWCEERTLRHPRELTKPMLERYQRHLFYYRKKNGHPLGVSTQHNRLNVVKLFFKSRTEKRLPKAILSAAEAEQILAVPDVTQPLGIRDRAMLETLYSTGLRRKELAGLTVFNLDAERGTVMVRKGKGNKDRLLPIGERALAWIAKYVAEVRPSLLVGKDDGTLFLSGTGTPLAPANLSDLVRRYVDAAQLGKRGSCHLFRHTMATLMLEGGADIRFIQQMLGHEELTSTQLYTQVSIRKLKEIHAATHPSAKLQRNAIAAAGATDAEQQALLAALDAEAADELAEE
jgi:integrase/recombinase XerD